MINNKKITALSLSALCIVTAAIFYNLGFFIDPETGAVTTSLYRPEDLKNISKTFYAISFLCLFISTISIVAIFRKERILIINISLLLLISILSYGWWAFSSYFYAVSFE